MESQMATIARVYHWAFPKSSVEAEGLKNIILFCAAGLFVSILLMTYGLDLSPGFF
jgi:hypothetical protein